MGLNSGIRQQQAGMEQAHQAAMVNATGSISATPFTDASDDMEAALTSEVQLAGRLIMMVASASDARLMLVNSLREKIAAGTYHVSAAVLADSMTCSMRSNQQSW